MIRHLLRAVFGCTHPNTTFPQKPLRREVPYVACNDCGAEFEYHWNEMRIGKRLAPAEPKPFNPLTRPRPTLDITGE